MGEYKKFKNKSSNLNTSISNLKDRTLWSGFISSVIWKLVWKRKKFLVVCTGTTPDQTEIYFFSSNKATALASSVIVLTKDSRVDKVSYNSKHKDIGITYSVGNRPIIIDVVEYEEYNVLLSILQKRIVVMQAAHNPFPTPVAPNANWISIIPKTEDQFNWRKERLAKVKTLVPFLYPANDDKIGYYWCKWEENFKTIQDDQWRSLFIGVAMSAEMSWYKWSYFGPQNLLVSAMVDFFWNVGAPEVEIDRLNDIGGTINPVTIGSWFELSTKGGMDGGWFFPVTIPIEHALEATEDGDAKTKLREWLTSKEITTCIYLGRDMGASPPRQTEIRLTFPHLEWNEQINTIKSAVTSFGFPYLPEKFVNLFNEHKKLALEMCVTTTSEGFVRFSIILHSPTVEQLLNLSDPKCAMFRFQEQLQVLPSSVEAYYLNNGYGYDVYDEGWNIVFHFNLFAENTLDWFYMASSWPSSHKFLSVGCQQGIIEFVSIRCIGVPIDIPSDLVLEISKWIIRLSYLFQKN